MPEFTPEQIQELREMMTAALAAAAPPPPAAVVVPPADMAAAAAAAVAAVAPAVAAVEVNAISHTFPPFWPEDVEGHENNNRHENEPFGAPLKLNFYSSLPGRYLLL